MYQSVYCLNSLAASAVAQVLSDFARLRRIFARNSQVILASHLARFLGVSDREPPGTKVTTGCVIYCTLSNRKMQQYDYFSVLAGDWTESDMSEFDLALGC